MSIRPIETRYKGYRFRSRLEARWAVFFDTLGVGWEYEREGFEMSTGERYLPDFWLPNDKLWIEVKGENPSKNYENMLSRFRDELESAILMVTGIPGENQAYLMARDLCGSGGGDYEEYVDIAAVAKGRLQLVTTNDLRTVGDRVVFSDLFETAIDVSYLPRRTIFPSVARAIDASKSARF